MTSPQQFPPPGYQPTHTGAPEAVQPGQPSTWPAPATSTGGAPSTLLFDPAMAMGGDDPAYTPPGTRPVDGLDAEAAGYAWPGQQPPAQPQPQQPEQQAGSTETEHITGGGGQVITLTTGTQVRIKKLKTIELLALTAIAVGGIGPRIAEAGLTLDPDADTEVFVAKFAGLVLTAFPYARDETMAFLRLVCEPVGLVTDGRLDRAVKTRNAALNAKLDAELANPDFDDTISIIEAIAANEGGNLQAWGKRLAGIFRLARRTGQIPASPTSRA